MGRLRDLAKREDRPVSELIRKAVDAWLERASPRQTPAARRDLPVFHGGRIRIGHNGLRDAAHEAFDLVLAITLKRHGVTTLYTRNTADFLPLGWLRAVDPIATE